jgi:hypothetical protein
MEVLEEAGEGGAGRWGGAEAATGAARKSGGGKPPGEPCRGAGEPGSQGGGEAGPWGSGPEERGRRLVEGGAAARRGR